MGRVTKYITLRDGSELKFVSVVGIAIYPNVHFKDMNYDEPVLYLQQMRRKKRRLAEQIKETCIPLKEIVKMR